jgi:cob(I)alamin adenosyltransferase
VPIIVPDKRRSMSIATKTGDNGTTGLMYNRRVSKCHPQVEAYGTVDELNSAIGLSRAASPHSLLKERLADIQKDLVILMGELATRPEDLPRYAGDGFPVVTPEMTVKLDSLVRQIESQNPTFKGWATPGDNLSSAALDLARTICRRAERQVCVLKENAQLRNEQIIIFLNRLSDALWLLARWMESEADAAK